LVEIRRGRTILSYWLDVGFDFVNYVVIGRNRSREIAPSSIRMRFRKVAFRAPNII